MYELAASKGCHIHGGGWTERKREKEGGFLPTGLKQESIHPSPSLLPPFLPTVRPPPTFSSSFFFGFSLSIPTTVAALFSSHPRGDREKCEQWGERKRELLLCLLLLPQLLSYSYNNSSCCLLLLLQLVQFRTDCVPPPALAFLLSSLHSKCRALFFSLAPPFYPSLSTIIISFSNPLLYTPRLLPFPCFLFIHSHSILSLTRMYKVRCVCMYMLNFSITVSIINCSLHVMIINYLV